MNSLLCILSFSLIGARSYQPVPIWRCRGHRKQSHIFMSINGTIDACLISYGVLEKVTQIYMSKKVGSYLLECLVTRAEALTKQPCRFEAEHGRRCNIREAQGSLRRQWPRGPLSSHRSCCSLWGYTWGRQTKAPRWDEFFTFSYCELIIDECSVDSIPVRPPIHKQYCPAARTKLKKLQKEEEAKAAAAANKASSERSPHTKEVIVGLLLAASAIRPSCRGLEEVENKLLPYVADLWCSWIWKPGWKVWETELAHNLQTWWSNSQARWILQPLWV